MTIIPLLLALLGLFLGRMIALKRGTCPHRGKVWGAFALPLAALVIPGLQFQALTVSFAAAIGAGFTAHASLGATTVTVLLLASLTTFFVHSAGF